MAIPTFQEIMTPLLHQLADQKEHKLRDLTSQLTEHFNLTEEEINQLLPGGSERVFNNRVRWARFYLQNAGLITSIKRGVYQITAEGLKTTKDSTQPITMASLKDYEAESDFKKTNNFCDEKILTAIDPIETIEREFEQINQQLAANLLSNIQNNSFEFFEDLVAELLLKMAECSWSTRNSKICWSVADAKCS